MRKKYIFLFTFLVAVISFLDIWDSGIQNNKEELFLNTFKAEQSLNTKQANSLYFYQQALIFKDVENIAIADCDKVKYSNYSTCKALSSALTLEKEFIIPGLRQSYFNDSFLRNIQSMSRLQFWSKIMKNFLIIVAVIFGLYIFAFAKDKDS